MKMADIAFHFVRVKRTKWRRIKRVPERVNRKKIMIKTQAGIINDSFPREVYSFKPRIEKNVRRNDCARKKKLRVGTVIYLTKFSLRWADGGE